MVNIKKFLALISVIFVILSNIAFAESDSSSYESRQINPEKEGIDYHKEGNVIVYPAQASSDEKDNMGRFNRGELSEEEMKKMAKEKLGDKFDEMEFKKSMMDSKDRAERKDSLSYENEGYQGHYYQPSYEGYSRDNMIFGMLFEYIGEDIDPRDIKQNCNEPGKIADMVISKLKEKIGEFQSVCKKMDEQESKCEEQSKKVCSQIGAAFIRKDATDMEKLNAIAYSCPPNKDAVVEACKKRNRLYIEQRLNNLGDECKKRFDYEGERLLQQCEKFRQGQVCGREKYMERCMGGMKKNEEKSGRGHGFLSSRWECYDGNVESHTDSSCHSNEEWNDKARSSCQNRCSKETGKCGVNSLSVSGECGAEKQVCPAYPTPQCESGLVLRSKTDSNGCVYYYCEKEASVCPEQSKPACTENQAIGTKKDDKGCIYYFCETTATSCPESQAPSCQAGTHTEKSVNEKGCVNYYCKQDECAQVSKPVCAANEKFEAYYDSRGCITSYQCISVSSGNGSSVTGAVILSTYDDLLRHCENSWQKQEKICSNTPKSCDKEDFIQKCKDQERMHSSDLNDKIERNCQSSTESEIMHAEERCSKIDDERKKCIEQSVKRCGQMKGNAEKCRELMTEERVKKFIIEEAAKRCKFKDILANEDDVKKADKAEIVLAVLNTATEDDIEKLKLFIDELKEDLKLQDTTIYKGMMDPNNFGDIKLLPFVVNAKISAARSSERAKEVKEGIVASSKVGETASKLASLRDSNVPAEYLYIIEDKASDVLNVSENLGNIEKKQGEKGFGYKIRLFLGLAKAAEQEEIKQLQESNSKLQSSIEALTKLTEEVPSDVAKSILKEQVENLKVQQADIKFLIDSKEKKAKGWFGVFG